MRKIASLFFAGVALVAAVQLTSCKKDKKDENSLVGTWMSTNTQSKAWINNVLTEDTTEAIPADEFLITFNSDNTYLSKQKGESDETGTYKADGGKLMVTYNDGGTSTTDTMDYNVSGNNLKFFYTDEESMGGVVYKYEFSHNLTRK